MFERTEGRQVVLVAVNRGPARALVLQQPLGFRNGMYRGLLSETSGANHANVLKVGTAGSILYLGQLSAFVASS